MNKPKMGIPQLWYHAVSDSLRIAYPSGNVEMDSSWGEDGWMNSLYSAPSQQAAVEGLKMDHFEFIFNMEDT